MTFTCLGLIENNGTEPSNHCLEEERGICNANKHNSLGDLSFALLFLLIEKQKFQRNNGKMKQGNCNLKDKVK